jgi:hypothetical protein
MKALASLGERKPNPGGQLMLRHKPGWAPGR